MIPVLTVRDMAEAIAFLSERLDFHLEYSMPPEAPFYAILRRHGAELHLNLAHDHRRAGSASFIIVCDDVDTVFKAIVKRGLVMPTRPGSPVHEAPVDQSWGTRELYIDDPSGNTVIFQQREPGGTIG